MLSGETIRERILIRPYSPRTEIITNGIRTTYGESVSSYDLRLKEIDTDESVGVELVPDVGWRLHGGAFVLAVVMEYIELPLDVTGIVHDKSSWARRGLVVQNTLIDAGWRGYLTLELTYHRPEPLLLSPGCGICQVAFHPLDKPTEGYNGKYQDQPPRPVKAL